MEIGFRSSLVFRLLFGISVVFVAVFGLVNIIEVQQAQDDLMEQGQLQIQAQKERYETQLQQMRERLSHKLNRQLQMVAEFSKVPLVTEVSVRDLGTFRDLFAYNQAFRECFDQTVERETYECLRRQNEHIHNPTIAAFNRAFLSTAINFIASDEDTVGLLIEDWEGNPYVGIYQNPDGTLQEINDFSLFSPNDPQLSQPVLENEEQVGRITLYYTLRRIDQVEQEAQQSIEAMTRSIETKIADNNAQITESYLAEGFLLFFVIMLAITIIAILTIVRPLQALKTSADQLAQENLDHDIDTSRTDEIGSLARSFTQMRDAIRDKIQDLQRLNRRIEAQNEELKKADKSKDEFLANTSHELRTPLNGIIGLSESLLSGVGGPVNAEQANNLNLIVQSGRRLANLVNDILDFFKMKNSKLHLQIHPVDLAEISNLVMDLASTLIGEKQIHLIHEFPEDLPLVEADENRLQQILLNLIGNAIKFTHEGEVVVFAGVEENLVRISVSDTGIGIPEDQLDQIFESFEQVDGSISRQFGGTGLGLAVTQQLVELHGGVIEVKSSEGYGSTFSFTLRVAQDQSPEHVVHPEDAIHEISHIHQLPEEGSPPSSSEKTSAPKSVEKMPEMILEGTKTILVVDDEPVNVQVLKNYLLLHNYQVLEANEGTKALALIEQETPDLVLLDLMLPNMSGYEVCQHIRKNHSAASMPVIMLTAKNLVEDLTGGLQCGANDFLPKPFSQEELLARIVTHLRLAETSNALSQANARLTLLLGGVRDITMSYDRFTAITMACNALLHQLHFQASSNVHIYFWEKNPNGTEGYSYFRFPVRPGPPADLVLDTIHLIRHSYSLEPPSSQISGKGRWASCSIQDSILHAPIWYEGKLYGLIEIDGIVEARLQEENREFVDTLVHSLAVELKDMGFTLELEQQITERTQQLNQSLAELEQQNTVLAAGNRKLEDINQTRVQLLSRLSNLDTTNLEALRQASAELQNVVDSQNRDLIRRIDREVMRIQEMVHPIADLYVSEKAIQSKRVLLADSQTKQHIIARMALGGTGVNLDIVSTYEEGLELLKQNQYDILCVNTVLLELARFAHDKHPNTQSVFITSEDAPNYLQRLMQYPFLSNIVSRREDDRNFTLKNILITVSKLTSKDLFGLEKYLSWGVDVKEHVVKNSLDRMDLIDEMEAYFRQLGVRRQLLAKSGMVAEELLMNAIYDAPHDANGKSLYNHLPRTTTVELPPSEQGLFRYACDGTFLALSTEDPFGALDRETILKYLQSCYEGQAGSMQGKQKKGGAGRGLFQIIETSDLMVINVKAGIKTEVITLFSLDTSLSHRGKTTSFHYFGA